MFNKDDSREVLYITYFKAVIRGLLLSVLLLLLGTIVFYFTNLPEEYMRTFVWIITVMSICYSCIYGAMKIEQKGWMHGALIGIIYTVILSIVAALAEKGQINFKSYIILFIMSLVIGSLSGMIGIILSNRD